MKNIRNFSIIAHIDHGKSTLADRMLEVTGTIEPRKMRDQVLDSMELERERGITIKMQPVRMAYRPKGGGEEVVMNLIDTPGHIDFSYEVSRALRAVEGSVILVDSTQGVQAQTLSVLAMAREAGLVIVPALSKVDSPLSRVEETREELVRTVGCTPEEVMLVSGRTGEGVVELLERIIEKVPKPLLSGEPTAFRSLVFDFQYSNHKGVIVFVRVVGGSIKKGDKVSFRVSGKTFQALEVGVFAPDATPKESLSEGEIGYIVTGIKEPGIAAVGDTVSSLNDSLLPLEGYMSPKPVVWASVYPESQDDFDELKQALGKLRLSDSSFTHEEESSTTLGRGFRCGFLGMLHLEIITERLKREFSLSMVVTTPSISYEILLKNGEKKTVFTPSAFPDDHEISKVYEPWARVVIITPERFVPPVMQVLFEHEGVLMDSKALSGERSEMHVDMPLRELMRNFFDVLKSVSSGYASLSYEILPPREAPVVRMDVLVADEPVPAFARVVPERAIDEEAEKVVERLSAVLPRQLFVTKIQAKARGRIIASHTIAALRKDVTGYLYGGDISRKKKLWEKQKKGKAKMKERGEVNIPHDVFLKMMRH